MKSYLLALLMLGSALTGAMAQKAAPQNQGKTAAGPAAQQAKSSEKPINQKGLINVTKQGKEWFFEVPKSLLGRRMLTTTRFISTPHGASTYGGEQVNQQVVYFEKASNGSLLLRVDMFVNSSDTLDAINKAVVISNEAPIIASFPIENEAGPNIKIKVGGFFTSASAALTVPQRARQQWGLQSPYPGGTFIDDIKTFPTNTEVRVTYTFACSPTYGVPATSTGRVTMKLNHSFVLLPEKPMMGRLFDPRVGYFTHNHVEFNDFQQRVAGKRFIARWRLEPKDSTDMEKMKRGELIEPKKPIVYYIDPATPKRWRKYLIDGVNDWQAAFEQAGWKNAIRAEEWPDSATDMSMDDARFSVIRYLASDIENAYGPHVSDPRSGEIIESHICWYHNVMNLVHDWYMIQAGSIDEAARKMRFDDELMGQLIRFVSSHEVGHTLGLRHNFGSSSTVPVDSLRNKAWVEAHGHTPSIMDYARFNYVAQPEDSIGQAGIFPRIGDYDKWAIEWGYRPMFAAYDDVSDHWEMERYIGDRLRQNRRLWWGDGEAKRTDPRCQTEDLGDDAVKASKYGIKNLKREIKQIPAWTYSSGDIHGSNLQGVYENIIEQFNRYVGHVRNHIGGIQQDYKTPDEQGAVYSFTPRAKQLAALDFIDEEVFNEPKWLYAEDYVARYASNPSNLARNIGRANVATLVNEAKLAMLNKELPVKDYLSELTKRLFRDMGTTDEYRRMLQATYVNQLVEVYQGASLTDPYRAEVLQTLRELKKRMDARADDAHLASLADYIQMALDHKLSNQGGGQITITRR